VNALKTRLYDKDLNPINHNTAVLACTQDLEVIYEENSNFYIFSGESFLHNRHRIGPNPMPYIMSRNSVEGIDIDEISD
jgi:N-acylneuraminate cytidylyltransferase